MATPAVSKASGSFVLRVPPALHAWLRERAAVENISLNTLCVRKLAMPTGSTGTWEGLEELLVRLAELPGQADLLGALLHGSWVRGEASRASDVDLLVVMSAQRALSPQLYREWEHSDLRLAGHPVQVAFSHLPAEGELATGLWAEVALDGIVLFERELLVSRRLHAIREDIAAGRIVRRSAHGQHYWVVAEEPA